MSFRNYFCAQLKFFRQAFFTFFWTRWFFPTSLDKISSRLLFYRCWFGFSYFLKLFFIIKYLIHKFWRDALQFQNRNYNFENWCKFYYVKTILTFCNIKFCYWKTSSQRRKLHMTLLLWRSLDINKFQALKISFSTCRGWSCAFFRHFRHKCNRRGGGGGGGLNRKG